MSSKEAGILFERKRKEREKKKRKENFLTGYLKKYIFINFYEKKLTLHPARREDDLKQLLSPLPL